MVDRIAVRVACLPITFLVCGLLDFGWAAAQPPGATVPPAPQAGGALAPEWIPLPDDHQQYLDKILAFWQFKTGQVQRYRCQFQRWEYENDQEKTYSKGVIMYSAPDKGLFRVDTIQHRRPAVEPGGAPQWVVQEAGFREHWVCDGQSIFEFDYHNQQLKKRQLPPEMRGQQIADGPLPFLFSANAAQIKGRFWIRALPPENEKEYLLEAIPKTQQDAANFRAILIILDEQDFLPKALRLFHRHRAETTFAFDSRETNWNILHHQLNPFLREFFEPKLPSGWQMVDLPAEQQAARPLLRR